MITANQKSATEIVINFGSPITSAGITPGQFIVEQNSVTAIAWGYDSVLLTLSDALSSNETWVEYAKDVGPAQIFSTAPELRTVESFEVLVISQGLAGSDPQVFNVASTSHRPTLGDLINAYGLDEAVKLTNSGDSTATQPDELKFLRAVEDAEALWNSELLNASAASLLVINPGKRRSLLTITRYLLDSHCPRKHVVEAYNEVIRNLQQLTGVTPPGTAYIGDDTDFFYFGNRTEPSSCGCGVYPIDQYL
jgi:phage gp36-like protein